MHHRLAPRRHRFTYNIFMFWINIDEIDLLASSLTFFSRNRFNLFSFFDKDHFKYPKADVRKNDLIRMRLHSYLADKGITIFPKKVFLLTHTRTAGYIFNPASFYYCFDENDNCIYVIAELSNTFGEMKFFLIDQKHEDRFGQDEIKYFYVSPFTELDNIFEFRFNIPADKLNIGINVKNKECNFFFSTLTGIRKSLSDERLLFYFFRFPLITLKIISAIHWQAFKLWLKKIPYRKKSSDPHLQRGITNI